MCNIGAWRAWPYNLRALGESPCMFSTALSQALPILFLFTRFYAQAALGCEDTGKGVRFV